MHAVTNHQLPQNASTESLTKDRRTIAIWLFCLCALVFGMVVLGGVTRLTHSGLSMVEWKPIMGILPPLNEAEWNEAFYKYQQFPEYQQINTEMDLAGFQSIFWFEYLHRLLGRSIGLAFFLPFIWFLVRRRIPPGLTPKLLVMFVFGGLQGLMGWYMVKSGLVDRPDVSAYRLTAHLGLAFLIYAYMFWVALGLLAPRVPRSTTLPWPGCRKVAIRLMHAVFYTALAGGLVAGTDAGFAYNTFPLMGGQWFPDGAFVLEPVYRNFFENIALVQFNHRLLALGTFFATAVFWLWMLPRDCPFAIRLSMHCLMAALLLQVSLGVSTLLMNVPVPLAAAHQAGALVALNAALWFAHCFRQRDVVVAWSTKEHGI